MNGVMHNELYFDVGLKPLINADASKT